MHIEVALPLSRRELLIPFPVLAFADGSQGPHMQFPIERHARLAVTSWPFRAYIESPTNRGRKPSVPGIDLKEFPGFVVEKFRVHNINPLADHFSSTDDTYLVAFREAVDKAGSHVIKLGARPRYFYEPDAKTRRNAIDYGHEWIDIAVKIGSPTSASTCRYPTGRSRILDSPLKAWASWPNTALNGISSSIWRTIMQRRRIRFYSSQSLRK